MHLNSVPKLITKTRECIVSRFEQANAKAGPLFGRTQHSDSWSTPNLPLSNVNSDERIHRERSTSYCPPVPTAPVHVPRIVVPRPTKHEHHKSVFVENFEIDTLDYELAGLVQRLPSPKPVSGACSASVETPEKHADHAGTQEQCDRPVEAREFEEMVRTADKTKIVRMAADRTSSAESDNYDYSPVVTNAIVITMIKVKPTLVKQRDPPRIHRSNAVLRARKLSGGMRAVKVV